VKKFMAIGLAIFSLALGYVAFQAVRLGDPIDWCGTRPLGERVGERPSADAVTSDWTFVPPGWDCVYYRGDENEREHVIVRRRAQ
jgi:hypothetical protein